MDNKTAIPSISSVATFHTSNRVASLLQYQPESHNFERQIQYSGYSKQQHTLNTSGRSERSNDYDEWVLPSSRKNYIKTHDATKLALLHASEKNIPPLWSKVTKTPWTDKAKLCTGYGVAMERTKVSADAPTYFLDPHVDYGVKHPHFNHHPRFGRTSFTKTFSKAHQRNEANESSYVLPGGKSILEANIQSQETFSRSNYRTFFHGKQAYMDHLTPPKTAPAPPINWNDDK